MEDEKNGGEEALITECMALQYHVRRALLAIRFRNTGYMAGVSLLTIISSGVLTTQLCRLIKIIHAECLFMSGLLWPSDAKIEENDSEGDLILNTLRSHRACDLIPDIIYNRNVTYCVSDKLDLNVLAFGMTTAATKVKRAMMSMDKLIDLVMQAMGRFKHPQRSHYNDAFFDTDVIELYNTGPIASWGMNVGHALGLMETVSEIQSQAHVHGSNEDMVKRLCSRVSVYVLFIEACAMKSTINILKTTNRNQRRSIMCRMLTTWDNNVRYISQNIPV